jgi:replicative DNA helicase
MNVVPLKPESIQPPHNIEAEQALLGAIFINNEALYRVSDFLEPKHFYEPVHQKIFELCESSIRGGKLVTPITMKSTLPADGNVAGMPIATYLARLAAEATTVINAYDFGLTIRDLADKRELCSIGEDLMIRAADWRETGTASVLIEETETKLIELTHIESAKGGFMPFETAVRDAIELASVAYQREGHLSGISTGLRDLDSLTGGLQKSDLVIIAGRPAMGKSALAMNIAYNVASKYLGVPKPDGTIETKEGGRVGFFSLEMSAEQLATRVISERAQVPSSRIRRGDITVTEFNALAETAQKIGRIPILIEESGGLSISQLVSRARRLRRQKGLDLMIVDYIQLLSGSHKQGYSTNRVGEVTEITTKLKALAKELDIPVIALSQLSRAVESRDDKRPQLSDLRESGSIEQDADVVMFVYREEYYLKGREPADGSEEWFKWEAAMKAAENRADLIIGKQRHGPTGTVELSFEPQFTRFGNLAHEDRIPERRGVE